MELDRLIYKIRYIKDRNHIDEYNRKKNEVKKTYWSTEGDILDELTDAIKYNGDKIYHAEYNLKHLFEIVCIIFDLLDENEYRLKKTYIMISQKIISNVRPIMLYEELFHDFYGIVHTKDYIYKLTEFITPHIINELLMEITYRVYSIRELEHMFYGNFSTTDIYYDLTEAINLYYRSWLKILICMTPSAFSNFNKDIIEKEMYKFFKNLKDGMIANNANIEDDDAFILAETFVSELIDIVNEGDEKHRHT